MAFRRLNATNANSGFCTGLCKFLSVAAAVAILAPRALILTPWAPTVVLPRLVQVSERSTCKLNYKVAILEPRALILSTRAPKVVLQKFVQVSELSRRCRNPSTQGASPNTLGADGCFTRACSGFGAFQVQI